ncbi:unnamed protein product [Linum tenue]|uniref:Uncharacterized protein n=1 Tax=Linum tenue TaxID=586396 RepID=A0AAV0R5H6_9ROSI|nr:unnamed protein product [Linum tenue]
MANWKRMMHPVKKVWKGVTVRLKFRKRGISKLKQDVRASKYNDVHVMWDMLKENQVEVSKTDKAGHIWKQCG